MCIRSQCSLYIPSGAVALLGALLAAIRVVIAVTVIMYLFLAVLSQASLGGPLTIPILFLLGTNTEYSAKCIKSCSRYLLDAIMSQVEGFREKSHDKTNDDDDDRQEMVGMVMLKMKFFVLDFFAVKDRNRTLDSQADPKCRP